MTHEFPGHYARIEGPDGSGKTTQLRMAEEFSKKKGIDTLFVREPGGTELGLEIRHILLTNLKYNLSPMTQMLLFTADRSHLAETTIQPALEEGKVVISDRGYESTKIYQYAGGGVSMETIESVSRSVLPDWYIHPDALAVLSISNVARKKRLEYRFQDVPPDKMESLSDEYYDKIYAGYQALKDEPTASIVNGEQDPDAVFDALKPVLFGKFLPRDTHRTIL